MADESTNNKAITTTTGAGTQPPGEGVTTPPAPSRATTEGNPFKERDKHVVIAGGVRYAKADAERLEVTGEKSPYTTKAVANKQRSTS